MDFIEGMPKSKGYSAILVVVDRLTKYAHFVALKHPFTTVTIANIFIQEVVCLHDIPWSILSFHDPVFMSLFWRELFYYKDLNSAEAKPITHKRMGKQR